MITINERVHVPSPPDVVWAVISDPSKVVGCIEGSELREFHDDGSFDALLAVKFAAIKVKFAARANLELDEDTRIGRLDARGSDSRGSTRVGGHAEFVVQPEGDGSVVDIDGVIELNGQLASLVTTGAAVVVTRMTRTFATRLAAVCAEQNPAGTPPVAIETLPETPAFVETSPESPVTAAPLSGPILAPAAASAPNPLWRRAFAAIAGGTRRTVTAVRHRWQGLARNRHNSRQQAGQKSEQSRQRTAERA